MTVLNFAGIEFPITFKDISKFERLNAVSINVHGIENKQIFPLWLTSDKKEKHVNLLYLQDYICRRTRINSMRYSIAYEGHVDVLPITKEKYIFFTKYVDSTKNKTESNSKKNCVKLHFIDSFKFLSTSLDKLVVTNTSGTSFRNT
ncbi:hypothetical protein ALC56_00244 [Trachymyrmex septentrionalis]|uniref:Uncharacterized protein n=1 Tax=Trachymyrmex septentrionalis TaxID=34720 RepID=A0A151K1A0_9HYME|nr:hypothetical protein ALC56_00244 [Trachymyrmex septentrionalis]